MVLGTKSYINRFFQDLERLKQQDTNNNIDIFVLLDAAQKSQKGTIYTDGYYKLTGRSFQNDLVIRFSEINSGEVQTSYDFINWAKSQTFANKYLYVLQNHGGGFDDDNIQGKYLGIGYDDESKDCLSISEFASVVSYIYSNKNSPASLLVYADACLMAGTEFIYEIKKQGVPLMLLSSEQVFPVGNFYLPLEIAKNNPSVDMEKLGKEFCDSTYQQYYGKPGFEFTLSLIDLRLNQGDSLFYRIDEYAKASMKYINYDLSYRTHFMNSAENTLRMDYPPANLIRYYYIDLGDYFTNIVNNQWITDVNVKKCANDVLLKMKEYVIYKTTYGYPKASGLTIFHNLRNSNLYYDPELYRKILKFGAENNWTNYIKIMEKAGGTNIGFERGNFDMWLKSSWVWGKQSPGDFSDIYYGHLEKESNNIRSGTTHGNYMAGINAPLFFSWDHTGSRISRIINLPLTGNKIFKFYWAANLRDSMYYNPNPSTSPWIDITIKDSQTNRILFNRHFYNLDPNLVGDYVRKDSTSTYVYWHEDSAYLNNTSSDFAILELSASDATYLDSIPLGELYFDVDE